VFFYILICASSCNKEISVTPPDSPPPNGYILIDSKPEGFQIYLNNKVSGRITPDSLTWLSTGTYNITLKKDLFKDTSITINVVEGERHSALIDFTKNSSMQGSITCSSNPTSAEIFINDSSTGHITPITLQNVLPGKYYVRYHRKNYRDDSVLVSVRSATNTSVYKFLVDTTLWQDYTLSNSGIPSSNITCVTVDKNNIVYAGSAGNGFFSFDGKTWQSYYNSLGVQINCCTIDGNNVLLFGTPRGFVAYNAPAIKEYGFKTSGLTDFRVQTVTIDKENNWYIGTQGGLNEVYQPNGAINWLSLNTQYIVASAVDNNDNVWVGLLNNGVAYKNTSDKWLYYSTSNSILQSDNVTAIAAGPTGEIWIGYGLDNKFGHGLTCFDGSKWTNYNPIPYYSKVAAIFIDKKNIKWVATNQGLVMFTSPASYTLFDYDNTGLNINGVSGIAEDSHGNIWISTNTGLYEYKGNH
jgi:ligand-binding sensor domain-containing protein